MLFRSFLIRIFYRYHQPVIKKKPEHQLLANVRTIENLAVAAWSLNAAGIWITPEGHRCWDRVTAGQGEVCPYALNTVQTRTKRFQDRIDFKVLLNLQKVTGSSVVK